MATTHQVAITIVAPIVPASLERLQATLVEMSANPGTSILPFSQFNGVHFARLVIIPPIAGAATRSRSSLAFLLDCDAPERERLRQLVTTAGEGLDAVLGCCEGYPAVGARSGRSRMAYLRSHLRPLAACYVNTIGRPLKQIQQEATLRLELEQFLDGKKNAWSGKPATSVRGDILAFVQGRQDLRWALQPAPKPSLFWRVGEWLHLARGLLIVLAAVPFALMAAPFVIVALRRRELSDAADRLIPEDSHVEELAAVEDLLPQNQFTAIGEVKPGRFRQLVARTVLWLVNLGTRHIYNRGVLTGVKSIHAARWVFLDDYRQMVFSSNYDGSLENYMDDFIDKVSWGLNAVFSNGVGYPRTNWLVREGATDEQAFKSYIRTRQKLSEVWYTAYGQLTTLNIANNARIRAGLHGQLTEAAAAAWLRTL